MAERKDYYAVLGVKKDADQDEIKRAYRKLARKVHPDVNPGDAKAEERFKDISEAYHVLGDVDRRKSYDAVGPEAFADQFDMSDFADRFSQLFRGGRTTVNIGGFDLLEDLLSGPGGRSVRSRVSMRPGRSVTTRIRLDLDEAINGVERTIAVKDPLTGGRRRTRVRIPPGVGDGDKIRLRGKGEPGSGGAPDGDLFLQVEIEPHPTLHLDGANLRTEVPVTVYEAALGAAIDVPTLNGSARINLPPGTRNGQVFRLRGKGAPKRGASKHGDLLVTVSLALPDPIDAGTEELMQRFRDAHPYDPRAGKR